MDLRETLAVCETFAKVLRNLQESQEKASILYDDEGLTRAEDFIDQIIEEENKIFVHTKKGKIITLDSTIGLNGLFRSDYSEC